MTDKTLDSILDRILGGAALVWHVNGRGEREQDGLRLDNNQRPARLVWSKDAGQSMTLKPEPSGGPFFQDPDWELLYTSSDPKQLNLATAFLTGRRTEGEMDLTFINDNQGLSAVWRRDQEQVLLLHNNSGQYLAHGRLATDGDMLILIEGSPVQERRLCYKGGQTFSVTLSHVPDQLLTATGDPIPSNITWHFDNNRLVVNLAEKAKFSCFLLR